MTTIARILEAKGDDIWSIAPSSSVYEAVDLMARQNVGALLVVEDGDLVGIVSERDYARNVILKGKSSKETPVRDIMTADVTTAGLNATVEEGMRLMTEKRIRHLPVVQDGALVGVISIGDLVKSILSEKEHHIQQLEHYITGER